MASIDIIVPVAPDEHLHLTYTITTQAPSGDDITSLTEHQNNDYAYVSDGSRIYELHLETQTYTEISHTTSGSFTITEVVDMELINSNNTVLGLAIIDSHYSCVFFMTLMSGVYGRYIGRCNSGQSLKTGAFIPNTAFRLPSNLVHHAESNRLFLAVFNGNEHNLVTCDIDKETTDIVALSTSVLTVPGSDAFSLSYSTNGLIVTSDSGIVSYIQNTETATTVRSQPGITGAVQVEGRIVYLLNGQAREGSSVLCTTRSCTDPLLPEQIERLEKIGSDKMVAVGENNILYIVSAAESPEVTTTTTSPVTTTTTSTTTITSTSETTSATTSTTTPKTTTTTITSTSEQTTTSTATQITPHQNRHIQFIPRRLACSGNAILTIKILNIEMCLYSCSKTQDCIHVNYERDTNVCSLYSSMGCVILVPAEDTVLYELTDNCAN